MWFVIAELAFILFIGRMIFIATLAVSAVVLPLSLIALERGCKGAFSLLLAMMQVAYVLGAIRVNDFCVADHLIILEMCIDDPSVFEEQSPRALFPSVFVVSLKCEESIVECIGSLAVA